MKKDIIVLCFGVGLAISSGAQAGDCNITFATNSRLNTRLVENGFQFAGFERACAKLKAANAGVVIYSTSTVLQSRSIGWAVVVVKDLATGLAEGRYYGTETITNAEAGVDVADRLSYDAAMEAMAGLNYDAALQDLKAKLDVHGKK
ncbi:hypothetical protein [Ramlibacter sp. AN1133]|uniref:hypothetical protein n=1 Tax=Ramlibacter sp. AN1133 TaxID=3133429 RepID=UPI0030BDD046